MPSKQIPPSKRRILMVCLGNICRSPLAEGIDISSQRARRFAAADFQRFDKIYAMSGDVIDEMRRIAGRQFDATTQSMTSSQPSRK